MTTTQTQSYLVTLLFSGLAFIAGPISQVLLMALFIDHVDISTKSHGASALSLIIGLVIMFGGWVPGAALCSYLAMKCGGNAAKGNTALLIAPFLIALLGYLVFDIDKLGTFLGLK